MSRASRCCSSVAIPALPLRGAAQSCDQIKAAVASIERRLDRAKDELNFESCVGSAQIASPDEH